MASQLAHEKRYVQVLSGRNYGIYKLIIDRVKKLEQISYAKTVYGQEEVDAVVKCLSESTQMGNYSRKFEKKIAEAGYDYDLGYSDRFWTNLENSQLFKIEKSFPSITSKNVDVKSVFP